MGSDEVVVPGWPRPRGYSNGRIGRGEPLHVGGQIAWDPTGKFPEGLAAQFAATLDNVLAVVRAANGKPEDITAMTVFVTDIPAYRTVAVNDLGAIWRERFGKHYPAMALVGVTELVEPRALVEIEAIAYIARDDNFEEKGS
jgi:enamine deaminase RidA (YjgF/YER057c/UK114 family)